MNQAELIRNCLDSKEFFEGVKGTAAFLSEEGNGPIKLEKTIETLEDYYERTKDK